MDAYHYFGNDLSVNSAGDILLISGIVLSQQRILRRLLTNPGAYIWHLNYGAGLPAYIGQPLDTILFNQIVGLIRSQMYLESSVAQNPPPIVNLSANQSNLYCSIQYTDAATTTLQVLNFTVSN